MSSPNVLSLEITSIDLAQQVAVPGSGHYHWFLAEEAKESISRVEESI